MADRRADRAVVITDPTTSTRQVTVDASGHIQVDIAADSVGIGGTQYAVDSALGATPTGTVALAIRDDALSALTPVEGDAIGMRVDANGALWVIPSGTVTVSGAVTVTNATASNFNSQVVGNVASAATDSGNPVKVGAIFNTTQPTVTTGQRVNLQATSRGALIVAPGVESFAVQSTLQAGSATIGKVNVPAVATGGATPGKLVSAATTNATSVKASAGTLYSLSVGNTNASARYVKFYNKASAPTVGSDTPVQVFTIPGGTAGGGREVQIPVCGIAFSTGIAFATTTGAADSDTGAVAANEIVVSYSYL